MMAINNYTKAALVFAIITVFYFLQNLFNIKKYRRGRQVLMPAIAMVYSTVAVILLTIHRESIQTKLNELLSRLSHGSVTLDSSVIILLNSLLVLLFLVIKCIARPILTKKWESKSLMEATSAKYYEYDEVYDEWFLQARFINLRAITKILAVCIAALTAALLTMTWLNGPGSGEWLLAFPCAALVVFNEIKSYICGQTREEYIESVLGDEADSRKVGNFYRIREIYEKRFPGQLLASHTGTEFMSHKAATDLLYKLEASEDKVDRAVAQYFLTLDDQVKLEPDSVYAANLMMHSESAVFFNPFYRDLGVYITLPLVNSVLEGKNCLVVGGTNTVCQDVSMWLSDMIKDYSHIRTMWRVGLLSNRPADFEIGILTFQQLYNIEVIAENRDFLSHVEFVLILEPSAMLHTGQIGFSILAKEVCRFQDAPLYCICDRYSDGLVDTMSHVLHTEITNVVAAPVPRCVYTGMAWDADGDYIRQKLFDKQTKYLGNGMELAAVAIKNQIPHVTWYGERKAPIRDIKWIVGQHFSTICRYMNIATQQSALYEKVSFVPSLWSKPAEREQFIIVEDEYCNMFTMLRTFLTRGIDQAFVNVLSENYLLRDYMRCNQQMFLSNPNAIPSLLPDYAKSERNTIIKLVIMMAVRWVPESEVEAELKLAGCRFDDTFKMCSDLLQKYTFADNSVLDLKSVTDEDASTIQKTTFYGIQPTKYLKFFSSTIRNAYYVVEDEKSNTEYIDAKMFGHISQTVLPGQFVTYDGKYYEVKLISPENGVILRRAADLYSGRKYYRQIRTYHFSQETAPVILHVKTVTDIEFTFAESDFSVSTTGYLEMDDNHDLRKARVIDLKADPAIHILDRTYHNKCFLKIKLPDTNDRIRFTVSILLSEVFHSVFPDSWQYLAVLSARPEDISGILNDVVYAVEGCPDSECIYIVEDSEIDLGLLDAVRRHFPQLLEIIADFLDWHFEKMREPEHEDPLPIDVKLPEEEKRRSLFLEMANRIRSLFGKNEKDLEAGQVSKSSAEIEMETAEETASEDDGEADTNAPKLETDEYVLDETNDNEQKDPADSHLLPEIDGAEYEYELDSSEETKKTDGDESAEDTATELATVLAHHPEDTFEPEPDADDAEIVHIDGTDIFEDEGLPEDNDWLEEQFIAAGISPLRKTRYQKECYLKYGYEDIDSRLRIEDVQKYFHARGYSNNSLTKARKRDIIEKTFLDLNTENHCDFCSIPLSGVSYEQLNDGRIRCNDCSASAITTLNEFKAIYYRVLEMMEMFYSIRFHVPISVKMTDAKTIAKGVGKVYRPTTGTSLRALGYAQRKKNRFSILIENGSPRLVSIETISHELTHIWQFMNWKPSQFESVYAMAQPSCTQKASDVVYEGMAIWASIQYLYQIGESYFAAQQEEIEMSSNDLESAGFRLYCDRYPLIKDMSLIKYSPFSSFPPLDPKDVANAVKANCHEEECHC